MPVSANQKLLDEYKFRHFLLFSKAQAEWAPGRMVPSSLSDAEICALMECMWIAEQLQRDPGTDLRAAREKYRLAEWAKRDLSDDALAEAMENAFETFSALQGSDRPGPWLSGGKQFSLVESW